VAVVPTKHGEQVVLRILNRASKLDLPDLGMHPDAQRLFLHAIRQPFGAVIACGPTGSGKTTTLYAALDALNEERRAITTIEDPVEYQLPGVNQVEVRAKAGDLAQARTLRSDPDVLLVGETRDWRQIASGGHDRPLVPTTLHTNDAPSAIARLQGMGIDPALSRPDQLHCGPAAARRLCLRAGSA
jgi:type II secretory ATPase GspE/PulE/Tfp pilus assembly ATPase PilB-like protein